MEVYKLNTINELAPMPGNLKEVTSSLLWSKLDNLDLIVLYQDKLGSSGAVFCESPGSSTSYPYIKYEGSGVDSSDASIYYDKISLKSLSDYTKLTFIITNFSELVLKNPINFKSYKGILKVLPKISSREDICFTINISSEELGDFLILSEISIKENSFLLKNINRVVSSETLKEEIPWAKSLVF